MLLQLNGEETSKGAFKPGGGGGGCGAARSACVNRRTGSPGCTEIGITEVRVWDTLVLVYNGHRQVACSYSERRLDDVRLLQLV